MINKAIFKSYDVRGIYPSELNEAVARHIGMAFSTYSGAKKVVVGYDARNSSPELFKALAEGLLASGVQVTTIGQVPTECLYFAVGNYDFDAGVMITASHNPKEYNGLKMVIKKDNDIVWVRGKDLLEAASKEYQDVLQKGELLQKDIWEDYQVFMEKFMGQVKPMRVAVDASSGVIGHVFNHLQGKLGVEILPLNFEPDGNFPSHSPNPLEAGASNQIAALIKKETLDFGIMFDGDADRIFLVDENGQMVSADIVLLLLAKQFLVKNPGKGIAYNLICSKSVPVFVEKWGGVPIRTQVGFVNVREGIIKNDGVMGGELSAHYCFADYFYCDAGMVAFLTLLQIISAENKPVSEIIKELSLYVKSDANFRVEDKEGVIAKIKEKYADGKQDFLDGVTIEYKDWWFNVRPSNTEPLLRLTIEADNQGLLEEKKAELADFIAKG